MIEKNNQLLKEELNLFKSYKENKNVLHLLEVNKEGKRFNMIFDVIEAKSLMNYIKSNEMIEK